MDISRETFKGSDRETQNLILFDTILGVYEKIDELNAGCEKKHTAIDIKIKKSGRINKVISGGGGLFGGFIATISSKMFGL